MACVSALYKRLKKIFSRPEQQQQPKSENCCCPNTEGSSARDDRAPAPPPVALVNPYALVDERTRAKLVEEQQQQPVAGIRCTPEKVKANSSCRGKCIRRVLQFSTSCSRESALSSYPSSPDTSCSNSPANGTLPPLNSGRYRQEFVELDELGSGEFGYVYRCFNRLDGCVYAVKRSRVLGTSEYARRRARNELHANAALKHHPNLVRYYSGWYEDDRLSIQLEYCNGGDLARLLADAAGATLFEPQLRRLLLHVASGLKYIHALQLAHMDIKPENIFISRERSWLSNQNCCEESSDMISSDYFRDEIVYKIGDLGHVTSLTNTQELEDEGDCRYLSKEVLREDYSNLTKADVFALGMTIFEAGGGGPLPKNGPAWHDIRDGKVNRLPTHSADLNELIRIMIHPEPQKRPAAADIVQCVFSQHD